MIPVQVVFCKMPFAADEPMPKTFLLQIKRRAVYHFNVCPVLDLLD